MHIITTIAEYVCVLGGGKYAALYTVLDRMTDIHAEQPLRETMFSRARAPTYKQTHGSTSKDYRGSTCTDACGSACMYIYTESTGMHRKM